MKLRLPRFFRIVVVLFLFAGATTRLFSTPYTWTGSGDGVTWPDPANRNQVIDYLGYTNTADTADIGSSSVTLDVTPTYQVASLSSGGTLTMNGSLTVSGAVANTGTISVARNRMTAGSISGGTVSVNGGIIETTGTMTTLAVSTGTLTLNGSMSATTFNINSTSALSQGGYALSPATINLGNGSNATVTNDADITARGTLAVYIGSGGGDSYSLSNYCNDFSSIAVTSADDVTLVDTDDIELGASTVSGTLSVTAGGHIKQTGILTVTGASSFTVTASGSDYNPHRSILPVHAKPRRSAIIDRDYVPAPCRLAVPE